MNVYSSFIHNCHNLEAIEMPFSRWVNKTTVWMQTLESSVQFSRSVVSGSLWPHGRQHARLPWSSITNFWSLLKLMSIESVMPSNHLIFCCPLVFRLQFFPASGPFPVSQSFESGGQSIGVSASGSVLPMNIQDWFPLGLTVLISLQSKGLTRVFFNTTVPKHQFVRLTYNLSSPSFKP